MIHVAFACNDPNTGLFAGEFPAVEFSEPEGDTLISMTGPDIPISRVRVRTSSGEIEVLAIGLDGGLGLLFSSWNPSEGNWCWCATDVLLDDARALLIFLLQNGFNVDEVALEGNPLSDLLPGEKTNA